MDAEEMTITVSGEVAHIIRSAVTAGRVSSPRAFVEDAVLELLEDRLPEDVLRREVLPAYDAMDADPRRGLSVEQVRERIAATHAEYTKAS